MASSVLDADSCFGVHLNWTSYSIFPVVVSILAPFITFLLNSFPIPTVSQFALLLRCWHVPTFSARLVFIAKPIAAMANLFLFHRHPCWPGSLLILFSLCYSVALDPLHAYPWLPTLLLFTLNANYIASQVARMFNNYHRLQHSSSWFICLIPLSP